MQETELWKEKRKNHFIGIRMLSKAMEKICNERN